MDPGDPNRPAKPGEPSGPTGDCLYFDIVNGCIEVVLPNDWTAANGTVSMWMRAYCPERHPDVTIPDITIPPGATAQQCATLICQAITTAYIQYGIPEIQCTTYFNGVNWVIRVCYSDCLIDGPLWRTGNLNPSYICP